MQFSLSLLGLTLLTSTVLSVPVPQSQSVQEITQSSGISALEDAKKNSSSSSVETGSFANLDEGIRTTDGFKDKRDPEPEPIAAAATTTSSSSSSSAKSTSTATATSNSTSTATSSSTATSTPSSSSEQSSASAFQALNEAIIQSGSNKKRSLLPTLKNLFRRQSQSVQQISQSSGITALRNNTQSAVSTGELAQQSQAALRHGSQGYDKRQEDLEQQVRELQDIVKRQSQSLQEVMESSGINDLRENAASQGNDVPTGSLPKAYSNNGPAW